MHTSHFNIKDHQELNAILQVLIFIKKSNSKKMTIVGVLGGGQLAR